MLGTLFLTFTILLDEMNESYILKTGSIKNDETREFHSIN